MNRYTPIVVLAALKREIGPFLGLMDKVTRKRYSDCSCWEGLFNGVKVRVITTGMATEPPIDLLRGCSMILSTGFCGALRGEVHTGDIVVSSSVAYGDMELIQKILDPKGHTGSFEGSGVFDIDVNNEFMTVIRNDFSGIRSMAHIGRTVTCSQAIKNRNEKARIGKYFDALAVDMEDYGRLRMARSLAAQIWCVRAVLDGPEDTIPGPWSGIGPGKLSALLRNIPPAQQSICRMLTTLVPAMFKRMKLK